MTQTLNTLLEHAERERDAAMAALQQVEAESRRQRQQMEQLQAYHADYTLRTPGLGGRAAPIEQLRSHHAFMQRLVQALSQQQQQVVAAEGPVARQRQHLLEREMRVASVRKLVERRQQEQARSSARLEQNRSDEAAMQRRWRDRADSADSLQGVRNVRVVWIGTFWLRKDFAEICDTVDTLVASGMIVVDRNEVLNKGRKARKKTDTETGSAPGASA